MGLLVEAVKNFASTGWVRRPVVPKEEDPDKPTRAAQFVARFMAEHPELPEVAPFVISRKPEKPEYTERVANSLGKMGVSGWFVDMAASLEASMVPNLNGYGNQGIKIPGPAQLILRQVSEEASSPELTIVPDILTEQVTVEPELLQSAA